MLLVPTIFITLVAFILAIVKKRGASAGNNIPWPFYAKKPLTQPEHIFYHRLVDAMSQCTLLAQVQLSQVHGVHQGFNLNEWNNRIIRMMHRFYRVSKGLIYPWRREA